MVVLVNVISIEMRYIVALAQIHSLNVFEENLLKVLIHIIPWFFKSRFYGPNPRHHGSVV